MALVASPAFGWCVLSLTATYAIGLSLAGSGFFTVHVYSVLVDLALAFRKWMDGADVQAKLSKRRTLDGL